MSENSELHPWRRELLHEAARARQLDALLRVGKALSEHLELDRLLPNILPSISEAMDCERSTVFLVDHERRELWSRVAEGVDRITCPLFGSLAGYVANTGETLNIPDAYEDERFDRKVDEATGYRTRNLAAMPMRNQSGKVIGVVEVLNKRVGAFDDSDLNMLETLSNLIAQQIENSFLYEQLRGSFVGYLAAMATAVDAKDYITSGHSARVADYSRKIAAELGLPQSEQERVGVAALLHDIGKIGVPDRILCKPDRLTEEEIAVIREHVETTNRILSGLRMPEQYADVQLIAAQHHERLDGSGYPLGLPDERIHPLARILAVADFYDALRAERYYRKAMPREEALAMLSDRSGTWFDPDVVEALANLTQRGVIV